MVFQGLRALGGGPPDRAHGDGRMGAEQGHITGLPMAVPMLVTSLPAGGEGQALWMSRGKAWQSREQPMQKPGGRTVSSWAGAT